MTARTHTCNGKRRFRDDVEAKRVLRSMRTHSTRTRIPVRAYECPICRGFHLTSKAS